MSKKPKAKEKQPKTNQDRLKELSVAVGIPMKKLSDQLLSYALDELEEAGTATVDLKTGSLIIGVKPQVRSVPFTPSMPGALPRIEGDAPVPPEQHPSFGMAGQAKVDESGAAYTEIDMTGLDNRGASDGG